jgi:hypothetical protein
LWRLLRLAAPSATPVVKLSIKVLY